MEAKVGQKVQAVDQLGRWEDAKIVAIGDEGFTVKFVGWSEKYNRSVVFGVEMRLPVEPFQRRTTSGKFIFPFFRVYVHHKKKKIRTIDHSQFKPCRYRETSEKLGHHSLK